jgi:hypothetical protein
VLGFRSVRAQDGTIRVSRSWDGDILSLNRNWDVLAQALGLSGYF